MEIDLKRMGQRLKRIFGDPLQRPLNWNLIDAFTRLEEREEAAAVDEEESAETVETSRSELEKAITEIRR